MDIIILGPIIAVLLILLPMILGIAFMGWQKNQNRASRVWHRKKLFCGLRVDLFFLWLICTYF